MKHYIRNVKRRFTSLYVKFTSLLFTLHRRIRSSRELIRGPPVTTRTRVQLTVQPPGGEHVLLRCNLLLVRPSRQCRIIETINETYLLMFVDNYPNCLRRSSNRGFIPPCMLPPYSGEQNFDLVEAQTLWRLTVQPPGGEHVLLRCNLLLDDLRRQLG